MNTNVPMILKYRCTNAALLAFFLVPIHDMSAVTHVPIFCPMIIGIAVLNDTAPVAHNA